MACTEWIPRWMSVLYGEASPEETGATEEHLRGCPTCREEFRAFEEARRTIREHAPAVPAAPRVVVLESRGRVRPPLAFAAGVLVAALVGAIAFASGRATAPPRTEREAAPSWEARTIEETVRAEVDRRIADAAAAREAQPREDWGSALVGLERKLESARRSDLDFVLARIAASDRRTDGILGETQRALQYVALGSNPAISPR